MQTLKNATRKIKSKKQKSQNKSLQRETYESCGNVFKDMGKSDEEANNLLLRSQLMLEIERSIKDRGWTQAKAAKAIGIAQPRIAELYAGRIDLFTLDTLIKYLHKLGQEVTVAVQKRHVA